MTVIKKCCKTTDVSNRKLITTAVYNCLDGKYKRRDTLEYLSSHTILSSNEIYCIIHKMKNPMYIHAIVEDIIDELQSEILKRKLNLISIFYKKKKDPSSGKIRNIGIQHVKQQLYDYIAIEGLRPLFKRIGHHQYASIKGRGQIKGTRKIQKWMRNLSIRYIGKADIQKCYESIDRVLLMKFLEKHVDNELLLWLINELINTFDKGLSIGSYLSQFLCNLYLSQLYHYIYQDLFKVRKKRNGNLQRVNLVHKALFYMDDIFICGSSAKDVHSAMKQIIEFAKNKLGLIIKENWIVFKVKLCEKMNDNIFVDMMGYRIYRFHITIRRRVFKRIRRCYIRLWKKIKTHKRIVIETARRAISYYGIIKHANSAKLKKKYKVNKIIKICKKVVSNYGKISNTTTYSYG